MFVQTLAVVTARVPVLKFHDPGLGMDVDVCINNMLAIYNTRTHAKGRGCSKPAHNFVTHQRLSLPTGMLATYALMDDRVRALGLAIKKWAKSRGINDPPNGTLSSYCTALTNSTLAV